MKKTWATILVSFFILGLNAQNEETYARSIIGVMIASVDPSEKLGDVKSIYYKGRLLRNDTSQIEFYKLLPQNFKTTTYNDFDIVTSIVNENTYYQYRNGDNFSSPKSKLDQGVFYDLTKFSIYFALNRTFNSSQIEVIEENDSIIVFNYHLMSDQNYKIEVDKEKKVITQYSCECLKIDLQKGYVKLKNYKFFDRISFPSRVEFWTEHKLEEVFEYDSISVNKLSYEDFIIPE